MGSATAIAETPRELPGQDASARRRIHEMDGLRAFAMLLGVVMHTAFFLVHIGPPEHRGALRHLMYGLHSFRMPLFFLVGGYFGALVVFRRGPRGYLSARARRIGIPLVVGALTIVPAMHYALELTEPRYDEPLLRWPPTLHYLWFLWFLVLFAVLAVVTRWVSERCGLRHWVERARSLAQSRWWLPAVIAIFAVVLASSPLAHLSDPGTVFPDLGVLAGYCLFFTFGWLLFSHPDPVAHVGRGWPLAALSVPVLLVAGRTLSDDYARGELSGVMKWVTLFVSAAATWAILVALFGLTRRWYHSEHPAIRYTADLAYWLYLIHVPIVLLLVYATTQAGFSTVEAFLATAAMTYAICFATYRAFVRYTVIGRVLHGPRSRASSTSVQAPELPGSRW